MSNEKCVFSAAACISAGRRPNNEDNFFLPCGYLELSEQRGVGIAPFLTSAEPCSKLLCGVFDGVGGAQYGDLASSLAAEAACGAQKSLKSSFAPSVSSCFEKYFTQAHRNIRKALENSDAQRMGSTAALLWLEDGFACAANIGDSRIYQLRANQIRRLSFDHTPENLLPDISALPENARKHGLLLYLGMEESEQLPFAPHITKPVAAKSGDVFILCTDGLYNALDESRISAAAFDCEKNPEVISKKLVELALENGGSDNITVVAVCVE